MAAGALPSEAALIERRGSDDNARFALRNTTQEPCAICGELGPQVALFYPVGLVVRLHAACEALWQQERMS